MRTSAFAVILFALLAFPAASQTRVQIINNDAAGEGFNDPTPAEPVGGNQGTTLGEQRLIAFQYAADLWASLIDSPIEIKVAANFDPLTCNSTSAVLGSAGADSVYGDFPNAPRSGTWYMSALASKLAGVDLDEGNPAISARFNSDLGKPNCGSRGWYLGLDNQGGPDRIDLVVVVLHELAHGLGFSTITDKASGTFLGGKPDVYSTFLFDNTLGVTWPFMTSEQRAASARNTAGLAWVGPNALAAAPARLGPAARFEITAPEALRATYAIGMAEFGGEITVAGVTAAVVAAEDAVNTTGPTATDACTAILNASALAGKIALIDRGECTFVIKAKHAQEAGALAVIIANNSDALLSGLRGEDPSITIPVIGISGVDGAAIRGHLASGVEATLRQDPQKLAGTDGQRRPLIYAPAALAGGSSVSHWDVSAEPDLLMEPSISTGLRHDIDLTRDLLADLGWYWQASVDVSLQHFVVADRDEDAAIDPGDSVRVTATIRNNSDVAGNSVVFAATMPDGVTVVPGSVTGGVATEEGRQLAVSAGALAAGRQLILSFDVVIDPLLPAERRSIALQGTVSMTNLSSSVAEPTVLTVSHSPLRAFKAVELAHDADQSGDVTAGDVLRYRIGVTNHSATSVNDVLFEDRVDTDTTLVSGTAGATAGIIRRHFAVVEAGDSMEIVYDVTVNAGVQRGGAGITNQGTITAAGFEPLMTDDPATREIGDATVIRSGGSRRRVVRWQ